MICNIYDNKLKTATVTTNGSCDDAKVKVNALNTEKKKGKKNYVRRSR